METPKHLVNIFNTAFRLINSKNLELEIIDFYHEFLKHPEKIMDYDYFAVANENIENAIEILSLFTKEQEENALANWLLGVAYFRLYKFDQSIIYFQKAQSLEDKNVYFAFFNAMNFTELNEIEKSNLILETLNQNKLLSPHFKQKIAIERGYNYYRLKDAQKSVEILEAAVNLNPENSELYENIAEGYISFNKEKALLNYSKAIRFDENRVHSIYMKGELLKQYNSIEEALSCFEKVYSLNPDYLEIFFQLGFCNLRLGNHQAGINYFKQELKKNPSNLFTHYQIGICYLGLKNYDKTLEVGDFLSKVDANFIYAYKLKSKVYQELEQFQKIIEENTKILDIAENDLEALLVRGNAYFDSKMYEEASDNFKHILQIDMRSYFAIDAMFGIGQVLEKYNDFENALVTYSEITRITLNHYNAFYRKGYCEFQLNKLEDALKTFNTVMEINPNFGAVYLERGLVYRELGNFEKAMEDLEIYTTNYPENVETNLLLGNLYYDSKQLEKTVSFYTEKIKAYPKELEYYFHRGTAYHLLQKFDLETQDYEFILSENENHFAALNNLALLKTKENDIDGALELYLKCYEINDDNEATNFNLGGIYDTKKDYQKAIHFYSKAIEINPKEEFLLKRAEVYKKVEEKELLLADYDRLIDEYFSTKAVYEKIIYFINKKMRKEGLELFDRAAKANKLTDEIINLKIVILNKTKDYPEILKTLDFGLNLFPKSKLLYFSKGFILNEIQNKDEAIEAYENAIYLGDTKDSPIYLLRIFLELEDYHAALELSSNIIEKDNLQDGCEEINVIHAIANFKLFNIDLAKKKFEHIATSTPIHVEPEFYLAFIKEIEEDNFKKVEKFKKLEKALKPVFKLSQTNKKAAKEELMNIMNNDLIFHDILFILDAVLEYKISENYQTADDKITKAVKYFSQNDTLKFIRGVVYRKCSMKYYEYSNNWILDMRNLPKSRLANAYIALNYFDLKDYDKAIEHFKIAEEIREIFPNEKLCLAKAYLNRSNVAYAIPVLNDLIENNEKSSVAIIGEAYYLRGKHRLEMNHIEAGVNDLKNAKTFNFQVEEIDEMITKMN
ncbi:tetratricopeptide repeat protein [Aureivirga sp. CE67]|uniref:tetratricopeptide repeat protein n=1 Tax=Aureivirga sp. CE67 TaxID=1788983 RepID=UPI0018CAA163|nr:tetratricopeptide repeat protein [Aureivirga sp. CE67]